MLTTTRTTTTTIITPMRTTTVLILSTITDIRTIVGVLLEDPVKKHPVPTI